MTPEQSPTPSHPSHDFSELLIPGIRVAPPPSRFVDSPYLAPFDGSFNIDSIRTKAPKDAPSEKECKKLRRELATQIGEYQEILFAQDRYGVLTKLQGMDTAGKGGMIKALTSEVNSSGVIVHSFKKPTDLELDRPVLWRTKQASPQRGLMTFFDRSDYEEVLIVRVHPEILEYQRIPERAPDDQLWLQRYAAIIAEERDLANNGFVVLKFWLNTSKKEQARQLLERIDDPKKHWKLSLADFKEREHWPAYREAAELMMRHTSTPFAPWYCIPGDDKQYARYIAADIMVRTLEQLKLEYPKISDANEAKFADYRKALVKEIKTK